MYSVINFETFLKQYPAPVNSATIEFLKAYHEWLMKQLDYWKKD